MMMFSPLFHIKENAESKRLLATGEIAEWRLLETGMLSPRNEELLSYNMSCRQFVEQL